AAPVAMDADGGVADRGDLAVHLGAALGNLARRRPVAGGGRLHSSAVECGLRVRRRGCRRCRITRLGGNTDACRAGGAGVRAPDARAAPSGASRHTEPGSRGVATALAAADERPYGRRPRGVIRHRRRETVEGLALRWGELDIVHGLVSWVLHHSGLLARTAR